MKPNVNIECLAIEKISGYSIVEQLHGGERTLVYRAISAVDQRSVIIKLLRQQNPSSSELVQFCNQYTIAKHLAMPEVISLESWQNRYILVMEDCGSISLQEYLRSHPLTLDETLAIAIQLADILHDFYQHRVIHKDLKPGNILIHPVTQQVKPIDFGIASLLPQETLEIVTPNRLEGTLAYLAPEQTGRMNRGIDYRTDFYALGVTLFELLTGQLPFLSKDPMDLVYCHLAKQPPSVSSICPEVPWVLSEIVSKLMAKNAENRYQNALGLKYDLELCLSQWQATGQITNFAIATRDLSDRFSISGQLYGRETEVRSLLAAFDRIASPDQHHGVPGASALILVAGSSGIGKTAIVNEVYKPITRQHGYFIKGKFDRVNRNIPFAAFVQAFRQLMAKLLTDSDEQLQIWKTQILAALGENARVIIEVIPELERIVGRQPSVMKLSASAEQNRFNLLFQKFVRVFTTPEHPLVIFLDDLQWADLASLKSIQLLISELSTGYLLIIGAYRDNEVSPAHPLMLTLNELSTAKARVEIIELTSLDRDSLNRLVADSLMCTTELARPLTELVDRYTQGNPFFATQLLKTLHQDGAIFLDLQSRSWQYDITKIGTATLTEDVVTLMVQQLSRLPTATQNLLKLAACIGNRFDLQTLAIVSERMLCDVAADLWIALQAGLILPIGQTYKIFQVDELAVIDRGTEQREIAITYKFLHDRVQQAAYSLISTGEKRSTHWQIGQLLLNQSLAERQEEQIFEIVNHLNIGLSPTENEVETTQIATPTERLSLAHLNLLAGQKAKVARAYPAALDYFTQGRSLLTDLSWQTEYDLTLALSIHEAEAAYLCTDFDRVQALAEIVIISAKTQLDRIRIYEIIIQADRDRNKLEEVVKTALIVLTSLNIPLSEHPTDLEIEQQELAVQTQLDHYQIDRLIDLPDLVDPQIIAAMQILATVEGIILFANPRLWQSIVLKMLQLSLQYGHMATSAVGYAAYSTMLCCQPSGIDLGYWFGQLALDLLSRHQTPEVNATVLFKVNVATIHWKQHWRKCLQPLLESYQSALAAGHFEYAVNAARIYCVRAYFVGQELSIVSREMAIYLDVMTQLKQVRVTTWHLIYWQSIANLNSENSDPRQLVGAYFNECETSLQMLSTDRMAAFTFCCNKLILNYLFADYQAAADYARSAEQFLSRSLMSVDLIIFDFYDCLNCLKSIPTLPTKERESVLTKISNFHEKLCQWAIPGPMNFQHKADLIAAELARVSDRPYQALELYDAAIAGAKANEYIQEQAIANELAAQCYLDRDREKVAAVYMQAAYDCYARWGAAAKIADLERRYANLLEPILDRPISLESLASLDDPHPTLIHSSLGKIDPDPRINNSTNSTIDLDFTAIIQASQSLSSTIELPDLLHQLTRIILHNSGGDFCALIIPNRQGEWYLEAMASNECTTICQEPLTGNQDLPVTLIQYVKNTQTVVVIDNLNTDLPVIDAYLNQHQPKSILCLSILDRGNSTGILYLHNQTTSHIFTHDRLQVLNLLCTQAAISLTNAQLFEERKQAEAQLQQTNTELVRATRLKDEFLATMSHELRTPLNAILGMSVGLQSSVFGPITDRQIKALQTIERSGNHLLELINDILDVAKIEAGQLSLSCDSIAVVPLCNSSLTFIQSQALSKQITLETKLPDRLPKLWIEERRIRQVLINLLSNAVKFTPVGGCITLTVRQERDFHADLSSAIPPNYLRISVIDTGIGIAPEHRQQLFQPFIQVDSTLNRKYEGTGLGLVLVKRIVELHGGSVELTSQVGVGSCFSIDLPCVATGLSTPESIAQTTPTASPLILLAEDCAATMGTICSYLKAKGYRSILAHNGREAIDLTRSAHPDLILMDMYMPEIDGITAIQQIRQDLTRSDLPIIALTDLAIAGDGERCLAVGATDYLDKPLKLKQLLTKIQQLLANKLA